MLSMGQKSHSSLKKKGIGAKSEFMRMHLAVYPYEVEFLSNVDYRTAFYFQKNYQVIGQLKQDVPRKFKNTKLPLADIRNIIGFRLYSTTNVVYKWSVYRKRDDGEEEYLDSCTLNLREAVNSFISPQANFQHTPSSILQLGFIQKEMRLKFPKVGVILMFYLFVAGEAREIQEFVQRRLINKEEYPVIEHNFLRTDSSLYGIGLSSNSKKKLTPTTSHISGILRKGSDPSNEHTFSSNRQKSGSNHNRREDKDKDHSVKHLSQSIDNLILNFDANGNIAKEDIKEDTRDVQLKLDSDEMEVKEKEDSDMEFKQEVQVVSNNELLRVEEMGNEENKGDSRDYGMLKLESDQGRITQDPIDIKLEMLELEAIEEEKPSRENTVQNYSQLDGTFSLAKTKGRTRQTASIQQESELHVTPSRPNIKKIAFVLVLSIILLVLAFGLTRGKQRKHVQKGRKGDQGRKKVEQKDRRSDQRKTRRVK